MSATSAVHVHNYEQSVHEATCTAQGFTLNICKCGDSFTEELVAALGHAWGEAVVSKEPTAFQTGLKTYTCTRCNETKTETIPATGTNANCTGGSACPSDKFKDIKSGDWFHESVDFAVTNGLFGGMSETTFAPNTAMTRAMLVTVLWRYASQPKAGSNSFTDVAKNQWYTDAVAWAADTGVVTGVGNNKFAPNGNITREQMAAILYRYATANGIDTSARTDLNKFPDAGKVSTYAKSAICWAVAEGLINGSDGKLLPQGNATRAQVAAILMRFILNKAPSAPPAEEQKSLHGDGEATIAYAKLIAQTPQLVRTYLYDIDKDNVCELILKSGTCEADYTFHFYTYRSGELISLGDLSGGHSELFVEDGVLICHYAHMGSESGSALSIKGDQIQSESIFSGTVAPDEEYHKFSQSPDYSENDDISVLSKVYVTSKKLPFEKSEFFTEENAVFTNGIQIVALVGKNVISVDLFTGNVTSFPVDNAEDTSILAVTDERIYFVYDDVDAENWWGVNVYSCDHTGEDHKSFGGGLDVEAGDGYIVLKLYRSDVSPTSVTVIDKNDSIILDNADAWAATIYEGAVYSLALDVPFAFLEGKAYEVHLTKIDSSEKTVIKDLVATEAGAYFGISDGKVICTSGTGEKIAEYSLVTGEVLS